MSPYRSGKSESRSSAYATACRNHCSPTSGIVDDVVLKSMWFKLCPASVWTTSSGRVRRPTIWKRRRRREHVGGAVDHRLELVVRVRDELDRDRLERRRVRSPPERVAGQRERLPRRPRGDEERACADRLARRRVDDLRLPDGVEVAAVEGVLREHDAEERPPRWVGRAEDEPRRLRTDLRRPDHELVPGPTLDRVARVHDHCLREQQVVGADRRPVAPDCAGAQVVGEGERALLDIDVVDQHRLVLGAGCEPERAGDRDAGRPSRPRAEAARGEGVQAARLLISDDDGRNGSGS